MGQTLTHGVYLPDEGERNCYSGLAANWSILDGAVGTIADHTTALAGKAPAVHTHTKSQITDFPAYGNTAGTICEGNDSRLSDARTPVAHTHTKSDVTDLLNSNFIPSANNSYDLGSSSYQWNKIYSADVMHTSGDETITGVKTFSNDIRLNKPSPRLQMKSTTYSSETSSGMTIGDIAFLNNTGALSAWIVHQLRDDLTKRLCFRVFPHTSTAYRGFVFDDSCNLYPENSGSALGTSTSKWKSFNGLNPGALSLPDMSSGTGVSLSAGSNSYSPPSSGWLSINLTGAISVVCGNFCHSGTDRLSVPVVKGSTYTVTVATSGTAYLFVSQGNV